MRMRVRRKWAWHRSGQRDGGLRALLLDRRARARCSCSAQHLSSLITPLIKKNTDAQLEHPLASALPPRRVGSCLRGPRGTHCLPPPLCAARPPKTAALRCTPPPHVAEARLPPLTPPSSPLVRRRHVHNARLDQTQPRGRAPSCSRGSMVIIMHVPCGLPATPPLIRPNRSVRPDPRCSSPSPKASGSVVHLQPHSAASLIAVVVADVGIVPLAPGHDAVQRGQRRQDVPRALGNTPDDLLREMAGPRLDHLLLVRRELADHLFARSFGRWGWVGVVGGQVAGRGTQRRASPRLTEAAPAASLSHRRPSEQ